MLVQAAVTTDPSLWEEVPGKMGSPGNPGKVGVSHTLAPEPEEVSLTDSDSGSCHLKG